MISSITAAEIIVSFTDVAAGTYTFYVEIKDVGFAYPTNGWKDDLNVLLVATTSGTVSSYAGGNSLVITGFGFSVNTEITVCG